MSKGKIIAALLFLGISLPCVFIYLTFTNSIDCNQLVIDTYEMHSKINIPDVDFVNCYYDKQLNTRISVYDLNETIDLNRFELVKASIEDVLKGSTLLTEDEYPKESNIYLVSGQRWGTNWTYAVDPNSKRLWAELNYN